MDYIDLILRVFFLSQTGIGLLGNSFSLLSIFTFHSGDRVRPSDHILKHIFLANSLVLLSKGIPQTMISFGWNNFLEDHGCKFLFYIHRVAREVCLSSTCLLSIFQAITIIPSKSRWAELKARVPKYIGPLCFLCWVVLFFGNILVPLKVTGPKRIKNITLSSFGYCFGSLLHPITSSLYAAVHAFIDMMCLGLLVWTSSSMVLYLYSHRQQVKYIHSSRHISRLSPEKKATQNILILVCAFVLFFTLSSISSIYMAVYNFPNWWLINANVFLDACFPTFCPFINISTTIKCKYPCCGH
uniref:Vomeronasal type-1 receptor n=1 Tax=Bos indicus x Bos taurus TaxID=30522 RepID=A0A4W2GCM8_BOBOX